MRSFALVLFISCFLCSGCLYTESKISPKISKKIITSMEEAYDSGLITADKAIKVLPFTLARIKELFGEYYTLQVSQDAQADIKRLEELIAKKDLTESDKGAIIGRLICLEKDIIQTIYDRYGKTFWDIMGGFL